MAHEQRGRSLIGEAPDHAQTYRRAVRIVNAFVPLSGTVSRRWIASGCPDPAILVR